MDKLKIAVVEDEALIAEHIALSLQDIGYEALKPCNSYSSAVQMLADESPDLVIIDIQLAGKKDGIDLAHFIRENYEMPFIFLTSNSDKLTVERAKRVNPPSYLIKPFILDELFVAIELALWNYSKENKTTVNSSDIVIKDALFVKKNQYYIRLNFSEIVYLKSDHVYIEVVMESGQKHLLRANLTQIMDKLSNNFFRIHRSYIVNLDYLEKINSLTLFVNKVELPIAKGIRAELLSKLYK